MLNARIRKAYLNNKLKIKSLNDVGDLTYSYESLDGKTQTIKDIIENNHEISKNIIEAKKPMIIFGESFLKSSSAKYLFKSFKKFLIDENKFNDEWNPLNIISTDAATVGNLDLGIIDQNNNLLKDLNENKFEIVFLFGQDYLKFNK